MQADSSKAGVVTRDEHIAWVKTRALAYVDRGDIQNAFASFVSDLRKHDETANHAAAELGMMLMITGHLSTKWEMRRFIEGTR